MTDQNLGAQVLDAAIGAARPTLLSQLEALNGAFVKAFGHLTRDEALLEQGFRAACLAKLEVWEAKTAGDASAAQETYRLTLDGIEALGIEGMVVGKAEAGPLLRQVAHVLILALAAGAGAGVQLGVEAALPGLGFALGPIAGAGAKAIIEELDKLI
jgi:hypothetical protein